MQLKSQLIQMQNTIMIMNKDNVYTYEFYARQWIKLKFAIFLLSQHVIRFYELPADTTQRFL